LGGEGVQGCTISLQAAVHLRRMRWALKRKKRKKKKKKRRRKEEEGGGGEEEEDDDLPVID
jgi:hypothetical protein